MTNSVVASLGTATAQGSLAFCAVWVLCRLLPRLPSSWRCWAWRLVALKFFVALCLTVPIPVANTVQVARFPIPTHSMPQKELPTGEIASSPENAVTRAAQTSGTWPQIPLLFLVWSFGLAIFTVRNARSFRRVQDLVRSASGNSPGLLRLLPKGVTELNQVRVLCIDGLSAPAVVAVPSPTILVPSDYSRLGEEPLVDALAHELAHVRRRDIYWSMLFEICKAAFWFNPLAWLLAREHRIETEVGADELARSWTGASPQEYGQNLLAWLAPRSGTQIELAAASGLLHSCQSLKQRLKAMGISRYRKRTCRVIACILPLPLAFVLMPLKLVSADFGPRALSSGTVVSIPDKGAPQELLIPPVQSETNLRLRPLSDVYINPRAQISALQRYNRSGIPGRVFTARLASGESVELLGLTSTDPKHPKSWSADGTPLPNLIPFATTIGLPPTGEYWAYKDGREQPVYKHERFVRQALIRVSSGIKNPAAEFLLPPSIRTEFPLSGNNMPVPGYVTGKSVLVLEQAFTESARYADLVVEFSAARKVLATAPVRNGIVESRANAPRTILCTGEHVRLSVLQTVLHAARPSSSDTVLILQPGQPLPEFFRVSVKDRRGRDLPVYSPIQKLESLDSQTAKLMPHLDSSARIYVLNNIKPSEIAEVRYSVVSREDVTFKGVHLHPNR